MTTSRTTSPVSPLAAVHTTHSDAGVGPYVYMRTIGRGSNAVVKLAVHSGTKQQVRTRGTLRIRDGRVGPGCST